MKKQELSLFDNFEEFSIYNQCWKDMPEFIQENLKPWRTIEIEPELEIVNRVNNYGMKLVKIEKK